MIKNITIDLNGFTWKCEDGGNTLSILSSNVSVTIDDSYGNGIMGRVSVSGGNFTLNGGTIQYSGSYSVYGIQLINSAIFAINGAANLAYSYEMSASPKLAE